MKYLFIAQGVVMNAGRRFQRTPGVPGRILMPMGDSRLVLGDHQSAQITGPTPLQPPPPTFVQTTSNMKSLLMLGAGGALIYFVLTAQ